MGFSYTPLNEDEAKRASEFPLLNDGIYDFIVVESKLKTSASGNGMIALKLLVLFDGKEFGVFDNLVGVDSMIWKTKHFCDSTNLEKEYASGTFNENYAMNKRGICKIITIPERPKNDGSGGVWKAKNAVDDYLTRADLENTKKDPLTHFRQSPSALKKENDFIDDPLPF